MSQSRTCASWLLAVGTIVVGCSPFAAAEGSSSGGDSGVSVPAADGGPTADGATADGGTVPDGTAPLPCARPLEVIEETFESFSAPPWEVRDSAGSIDIVDSMFGIGAFGTGKFLLAQATVNAQQGTTHPASIFQARTIKPLAARLDFDLAVAELTPYVEFGCALGFGPQDDYARIMLRTQEQDPAHLFVYMKHYFSGGNDDLGQADLGVRQLPLVTHVTTELKRNGRSASVEMSFDGKSVGKIGPATVDFDLNGSVVMCGMVYMAPKGGDAKAKVGIDNVRLAICPE